MGLSLENIDVFYGGVHAVKDVSLQLETGQILALLGASGSGKSSLLRAIAGLEASSGQIVFDGEDVSRLPVHRRGFGLMFQDGQLFPHQNVGQNVAFGLRGRIPRGEWEGRATQLLETVGLPGTASRLVTTLSGGQQQRVALARALAPRPRLLLLDEPLSALDRALREQLSVEVRRIVKETGTTAVYVTHDQDEAFTVADQVAIMEDGVIARMGTPAQVWAQPGTRSVASFLGYSPILGAEEVAAFGVDVAPGSELACGPGAWSVADTAGEGAAVQVVESHAVRGAKQVTVRLDSGKIARVNLPIHTRVSEPSMRVKLDAGKCAQVTSGPIHT
ncbi:MAG: ABC transporter ATP-binding protein [Actinomyces sp.]|nr:ABC transporter ATP-binding protein [Actinomyces sp.]